MRQTRTRFKGEMEASGGAARPERKLWSAGSLAPPARSMGRSETRVFQSGIRGLEQSPSGATLKRAAMVLLRYCYGIATVLVRCGSRNPL